jgi:hypothetical protein
VSAPRRDLTRAELAQLVRALAEHLDWIGWGDSYERECSESLREHLRTAVLPALTCEDPVDGDVCLTVRTDRLERCHVASGYPREAAFRACTPLTCPVAVWRRVPFSLVRCAWREPGKRVRRHVRGMQPCTPAFGASW